jgi:hypothetical protein
MSVDRVIGAVLVGVFVWAFSGKKRTVAPELQGLFECFHETIKLDENDERRKLREKREVLLEILKKKLVAQSLAFESFDQGSYAMRTGVVPKDGNYDIDVGLIFDCSRERFPDPVVLKCLIRDALSGSNRTVDIRRACVTVTYMRTGQPEYHVDLALYLKQPNGRLLIAKGREFSEPQHHEWALSAPQELTQHVLSRFAGEDQAQFRRCIRYLKRWRDENFCNGAPLSVALTLAAASWFEPWRTKDGTYVDLEALHSLVKKMRGNFGNGWSLNRLAVRLPGPVKADLMAGLSDSQMLVFSERLENLELALETCFGDVPLAEAAVILASKFGSDFPLPDVTLARSENQTKRLRRI